MGLPPVKRVSVAVDVARGGFDALLRDLTRLDAADTYRAAVQVSANEAAALTRLPSGVGGGVGTVVHQTVIPNFGVIAEAVFDHDRRVAIAEGYEQP